MKQYFLPLLALLLTASSVVAQDEDYLYEDYTYVTNVKSVKLYPSGYPLEVPIIQSNQSLQLSFDDLDNQDKDYTYKIIHCTKDWVPSDLEVLEYIDGFQDEEIDKSYFSVNTLIPYINYQLTLPNDDISWIISGNYLLVIYEGNEEDDRIPVITRRFMVVDKKVNVSVNKRRPLNVLKLDTHHEFDLFVNNKDFKIQNAQTSVTVVVMQNYRWNTALTNLKPRFVVGEKMTIDNTGILSFPALKEYRPIDIRSLDYVGDGIHSIDLNDYGTNVLMQLGKPRRDSYYTTLPDANGQFIIQNKDQGTHHTWGDYANVIFTLEMDKIDEDVYVMGSFTEWQADEMYKMRYYEGKNSYIAEVQLKQGFYDYHFAVDKNGVLDAAEIEGSWADTENLYHVLVYLREPADRYDRLVGSYIFNSNQ